MLSVGRRGGGDWRDGCEGGRARGVETRKAVEGEGEMMKVEFCDDDGVAVFFVGSLSFWKKRRRRGERKAGDVGGGVWN